MYKHCTVCIAVQLSIHSLHSDLCGICLCSTAAGLPTVLNPQRELFISSLNGLLPHEYVTCYLKPIETCITYLHKI